MNKACSRCKRVLPLSKFHRSKRRKDGHNGYCKDCMADTHRRRTYGLTEDDYIAMYNELKGCCPLCHKFYPDLAVDHNHETGQVRGLLCLSCNRVLGYVENSSWLTSALEYLGRNN